MAIEPIEQEDELFVLTPPSENNIENDSFSFDDFEDLFTIDNAQDKQKMSTSPDIENKQHVKDNFSYKNLSDIKYDIEDNSSNQTIYKDKVMNTDKKNGDNYTSNEDDVCINKVAKHFKMNTASFPNLDSDDVKNEEKNKEMLFIKKFAIKEKKKNIHQEINKDCENGDKNSSNKDVSIAEVAKQFKLNDTPFPILDSSDIGSKEVNQDMLVAKISNIEKRDKNSDSAINDGGNDDEKSSSDDADDVFIAEVAKQFKLNDKPYPNLDLGDIESEEENTDMLVTKIFNIEEKEENSDKEVNNDGGNDDENSSSDDDVSIAEVAKQFKLNDTTFPNLNSGDIGSEEKNQDMLVTKISSIEKKGGNSDKDGGNDDENSSSDGDVSIAEVAKQFKLNDTKFPNLDSGDIESKEKNQDILVTKIFNIEEKEENSVKEVNNDGERDDENSSSDDDVSIAGVAKQFKLKDKPFPNLDSDDIESEEENNDKLLTQTPDNGEKEEDSEVELTKGVEITFNDEEEEEIEEKVGRWTFTKGAARTSISKTSTSNKPSQSNDSLAEEVPTDGLKVFRETEIQLPRYKPKQYSSFAEFRSALRQQKQPQAMPYEDAVSLITEEAQEQTQLSTPMEPKSPIKCFESNVVPLPITSRFRLPTNLPKLHFLRANDEDIIDLNDDEHPIVSKQDDNLQRLLSRFSQHTQVLSEIPVENGKEQHPKPIEYSIVKKVADKETGHLDLRLDTVVYKPDEQKTTIFPNRKQWDQHRQELCEVMRMKRLKSYEKRMRDYQETHKNDDANKKSNALDEDDEEWEAGDEDDESGSSSNSSSSSSSEEEEDDDEELNISRKKKKNPFMDDEAEEDEDRDTEDEDEDEDFEKTKSVQSKVVDKCRASALSIANFQPDVCEDFTDLPDHCQHKNIFQAPDSIAHSSSACRMLQRTFGEPGDVDLFAMDTTLPSDKALNMSKVLSSTRYEPNVTHDQSTAPNSERSSWNDTPYSLLYSQRPDEYNSVQSTTALSDGSSTADTMMVIATQSASLSDSTPMVFATESTRLTHVIGSDSTQMLPSDTQLIGAQTQPLDATILPDVLNKIESRDLTKPQLMRANKVPAANAIDFQDVDTQPIDDLGSAETQQNTQLLVSQPREVLGENSFSLFSTFDEGDQDCIQTQLIQHSQLDTQQIGNDQQSIMALPLDSSQLTTDAKMTPGGQSMIESLPAIASIKKEDRNSEGASTQVKRRRVRVGKDEMDDEKVEEKASEENKKIESELIKHDPVGMAVPSVKRQQTLDFLSIFKEGENVEEDEEDQNNDELDDAADDGEEDDDENEPNYSSSDEEMQLLRQTQHKMKKTKFRASEFIEEEAELSGDEMEKANFADDNYSDSDDAGSLKDFVDENEDERGEGKLRREVERVHNRLQADDDQRELRYLKEVFFEDGDLYDEEGKARQRRFRWRGLENDDPLLGNQVDIDGNDDDDEEDAMEGTSSLSRFLSGGAGTMSRWLLQSGIAPDPENENANGESIMNHKSLTQPVGDQKDVIESPESEISKLGRKALLSQHRSETMEQKKSLLLRTQSGPLECSSLKPLKRYGSFLSRNRSAFLLPSSSANTTTVPNLSSQSLESSDSGDPFLEEKEKTCVMSLRRKASLSCFTVTRYDQKGTGIPLPSSYLHNKPSPFIKTLPKAPPKRPSNEPGPLFNAKRPAFVSVFEYLK